MSGSDSGFTFDTLLLVLPRSKFHLAIGSYGLTICRTLYYHFSPKSGDLKTQYTALKKLTDLYPKLELCSHS